MPTQEWKRKGGKCVWFVSEAQTLHMTVYLAVLRTSHKPLNTEINIGEMEKDLN